MASVIRGSGASTLGGALDVQGVLTYEDVTSVDSIGIVTARSGINVGTGASIFSPDTNELALGTNNVERLRIASGGDVNIGPSANANGHGLLTLSQSASAAFNALVIQQGNTAFTATDGLQIGIDAGVNAYFKLYENRDFYFTTGTSNTEKLRIDSDNTVHIGKRDGNSNSTHFGTSRVSICGPDPIATSVSKAGSYLAIGNNESELNGVYPITFGYTTNTNSHQPAYIAYKTTNSGGAEYGDLLFGTRNVTSDTEPTERLRIDSAGKVLIGIQIARAGVFNTNLITPHFQMESAGTVDHNRMMSLVSNPGATGGYEPVFIFGKSRSSTAGGFGAVGNNDGLGKISFQGADGSELVEAASISAAVDGAVNTANDMPGRLSFYTTPDGVAAAAERLRIKNDGSILFYGSSVGAGGMSATIRENVAANGTLDLNLPGTSITGHLYVTKCYTLNAGVRTSRIYFVSIRLNGSPTITQLNSSNGTVGSAFTIAEASGGSFPNKIRLTDTSNTLCNVSMHFVGSIGL